MLKRLFFLFLIIFWCNFSHAAAVAVSKVQSTYSGVIQQKMQSRGFAANDPRYIATLPAISGGVSTIAGSLTALVIAGTSPSWGLVAAAAGAGYLVSLGVDGLIQWGFSDSPSTNPNVQVSGHIDSGSNLYPQMSPTGYYSCGNVFGANANAVFSECFKRGYAALPDYQKIKNIDYGQGTSNTYVLSDNRWNPSYDQVMNSPSVQFNNVSPPVVCASGQIGYNGSCITPLPYLDVSSVPVSNNGIKSFSDAVAALPDSEKNKPLNPSLVANDINSQWRKASSLPGYSGVPYDLYNPVTAADVSAFRAANPDVYPSVGDFVASPSSISNPYSLPTDFSSPNIDSSANPNPNTNTNPNPSSNLGVDPNIGMPTLENIPTASSILSPILNLMPDLKSYALPSHSSVCPKPSLDFLGKNLVLTGHCDLLESENVANTLNFVMLAVWSMLGIFIILRA